MALVVASATDLGLQRQQNEDSLATWSPPDTAARERRGVLLVVADGMGGASAGEVASRLTIETVLAAWREGGELAPLAALREAVERANRVVHRESVLHPDYRGMGTTCTAAVVRGAEVHVAHVGDSRAYLVHRGAARALTRDHTLVAQMVAEGFLTPDQARVDSRRNVVTRSVGVSEHVEVDAETWGPVLEPGDSLVLCTDGLHGQMDDRELAARVSGADPAEACRRLIALANERGGPDNISVIVARNAAEDEPPPPPVPPRATEAPGAPAGPVPPAPAPPLARLLLIGALALALALVLTAALRLAH